MSTVSNRPLGVVILGSTGSVGSQALDVIAKSDGAFRVIALTANTNDEALAQQIERFQPTYVALRDEQAAERLRTQFGQRLQIRSGDEALCEAVTLDDVDIVLVSVVGFAGVKPTYEALRHGRRVALANKETLVAAGDFIMKHVQDATSILPVDSEHAALWQLLAGRSVEEIEQLILTASGGPFRRTPEHSLQSVTPQQALQHPTWNMGGKITIDSATLMNKGLEVIEAAHLFRLPIQQVSVVIHPQSIIHSLVEMKDGSMLAQFAVADMRLPIAQALYYPHGAPRCIERLDLTKMGTLKFEEPDTKRFPCLQLAMHAGAVGKTMPAVLNAANEIAVYAFLNEVIRFTDIPRIIEQVMAEHNPVDVTLQSIIDSDDWARKRTRELIKTMSANVR